MQLVNQAEWLWYEERAQAFLDGTDSGNMFHDARGIAKSAIMEYLANEDGLTIFSHLADKEEEDEEIRCINLG
jgi:hypothetical protein